MLAGPSLLASPFSTTYVSRYSPAFTPVAPPFAGVPHTSSASQTFPLEAGRGPGAWLAVERDLGAHLGLQLSAHYGQADLAGEPGRYELAMHYTSRPPPSYEPVEVSVARSEATPRAEGTLLTLVVALDLVARANLGTRGRIGVFAGPAWLHAKGEAQSLIYTSYFMGGHSVAFEEDYLVSFEFPASALGIDAGAFAEVDLGGRAGLRLDVRYSWAPEKDAEVTLRDIVNPEDVVRSLELAYVQSGLAPAPVPLDLSVFRASLALSVRF